MSRAEVLRDKLLELAEGERAQAGAVLGELFQIDPVLLREALAAVLDVQLDPDTPLRRALAIAGPWTPIDDGMAFRADIVRGETIAEVRFEPPSDDHDPETDELWMGYVYLPLWAHGEGRVCVIADVKRDEAQRVVDAMLSAPTASRRGHLLPQPEPG